MTDVYLRHIHDATGVKVGEVEFSEAGFDAAVRLAKLWSVAFSDDDDDQFHSARFRVDEGRAYFEITIGSEVY